MYYCVAVFIEIKQIQTEIYSWYLTIEFFSMIILLVPYYYFNNGTSFFMLGLILPIKFPIKIYCDWDSGMKTIIPISNFK